MKMANPELKKTNNNTWGVYAYTPKTAFYRDIVFESCSREDCIAYLSDNFTRSDIYEVMKGEIKSMFSNKPYLVQLYHRNEDKYKVLVQFDDNGYTLIGTYIYDYKLGTLE